MTNKEGSPKHFSGLKYVNVFLFFNTLSWELFVMGVGRRIAKNPSIENIRLEYFLEQNILFMATFVTKSQKLFDDSF